MRILITCTGSWGTGSFMAIDAIAQELLQLGHQVKIFFPDSGIDSEDKSHYYSNPDLYEIWKFPLAKDNVKLDTFPLMIPDPNPRSPNALTFKEMTTAQLQFYMDEFSYRIQGVIQDFQPDIIECEHIWIMNYIIYKLGYPYVTGAHMSDQLGFNYDMRMRPLAIEAAKHSRFIFAVSERVKKEIMKLYGLPAEQIKIMHNGYNKNIFKSFEIDRNQVLQEFKLEIPTDATIVTFAGKISLTKGFDILLAANRLLRSKGKIHFLVFGSGDVQDIVRAGDVDRYDFDRIHILGHQLPQKLANAHNIAKLSVAPSRVEGFSIACLEAMACGLPVVVTRDSGSEEFVVGKVIEQENPQQLANAILSIISMPADEYKKISSQAIKKAAEFSWRECAKERLTCFYKLLA
jgi:glycosyltransferase involved in cell wall biosynthesis